MKNRLAFWKGTEKDKEKGNKEGKKKIGEEGICLPCLDLTRKKIFFKIKEKHLSYPQPSERKSIDILSQYVSWVATLPGHYPTGTLCVESAVSAERKGAKPHAKASRHSFSRPSPTPPSFTENRKQQLTSTENNHSYKYC